MTLRIMTVCTLAVGTVFFAPYDATVAPRSPFETSVHETQEPGSAPRTNAQSPQLPAISRGRALPPYPGDAIVATSAPIQLEGGGEVSDSGQATDTLPMKAPGGPGGLTPKTRVEAKERDQEPVVAGTLSLKRPNRWEVPAPPSPYKPLVPPDQPIVGTVQPSAYLPGAGSVGRTGEYRYEIPIQVPPGRAGMQPNLALSYSSRAGDGPLGVGWSVSGLSEIHRCAKNFAIDATSDGVDYRSTDALCIDGNRLISVGHSNGKDYYVTEQETFARIESTYDEQADSRAFSVYAKDARILDYDPIVMKDYPATGQNVDLVWPLARIKDRSGNTMTFKYESSAQMPSFSYAILSISYPEGRTVAFDYEDRTLPTVAWTKGIARIIDRQLWRIRLVTPNHADFGNYLLDFTLSTATSRPLLTGVQRCAAETCTQVKHFAYDQSKLSFRTVDYNGIPQPFVSGGEFWADVAVADVDGNGLDDLVYPFGEGNPPASQAALAVAIGMFQPSGALNWALQPMNLSPEVTVPVDIDGDGRLEVVLFPATGGQFTKGFRLYRWDAGLAALVEDPGFPSVPLTGPNPFSLAWVGVFGDVIRAQTPYFADIDGDGRPDMLRSQFSLVPDENSYGNFLVANPRTMLSRNSSGVLMPLEDQGISYFPEKLAYRGGRVIDRFGEHRAGLHVTDGGQVNGATAMTLYQDDSGSLTVVADARCDNVAGRQYELRLDVNGDGLEDRVCVRAVLAGSGDAEACLNTGATMSNQCGNAWFVPELPAGHDDGVSRFLTGDLNGDGLDDLVIWRQTQRWILIYHTFPTVGGWGWTNDAAFELPDGIQVARLGDFDGDGRLDIAAVYRPASLTQGPTLRLYLQNFRFPDLLYEVREEGNARASETVKYEKWAPPGGGNYVCSYPQRCVKRGELTVVQSHRVLNPSVPDPPSSGEEVVLQITVTGIESVPVEVSHSEAEQLHPRFATYFTYDEPRVDFRGRGFLGFKTVRTWEPQRPIQVTTTYYNDVIDTSQPSRTAYPRASVPSRTRTVIPILNVPKDGRGVAEWEALPATVLARIIETRTGYTTQWTASGSYWVHPENWTTNEWEEDVCVDWGTQVNGDWYFDSGSIGCVDGPGKVALRTQHRTYAYDAYGNLKKETVDTEGGTRSEIETDYDNRISDWLLGLPETRTERSAKGPNHPWATRVTTFSHDPMGLLETVNIEPFSANPDLRQLIEYKRNTAGLVIGVRRAAPGLMDRHQYVHYDDAGVFPDVIWNDLGLARWATYDDAVGLPIVTLENVKLTQWVHDGLGRIREVYPEGAAKLTVTYALAAADVAGQFVGMEITTGSEAGDLQVLTADERGRIIEQRHRGFDGQWIHRAIGYDVLGRTRSMSRPGYGAPATASALYEWDSLDRITSEVGPDGKTVTHTHTFFDTTIVDAEQRTRKVVRDVNGRVASTIAYVTDPSNPQKKQALETKFGYAEFDLLETVVDPYQNVTTMWYDRRGRRRLLIDPDAGWSTTAYNGFGEPRAVLSTLSAAEFHYDQAGRLLKIDDAVDGITEYVWDKLPNDSSPNAIGQLVEGTSPDGTKTRRIYDVNGRLTDSVWDVGLESFTVSVAHDKFGRMEKIEFPSVDGIGRVTLGYSYTDRNYLREVRDITSALPGVPVWMISARNADDALAEGHYGYETLHYGALPAMTLVRGYDEQTGRLKTIHGAGPGATAGLFDLTYEYHDNGQVASRTDGVAGRKESFDYDELNRLESWTLQKQAVLGFASHTQYAYDFIGNLTEVYVGGSLQVTNHYDGPRPHALEWSDVTSGGVDDFQYDAKGRQVHGGGRDVVNYSTFDLPTSIETGQGQTTFVYDAHRSRIRTVAPSGDVTTSIGSLYERRGKGPHDYRHVFRVPGGEGPVAELVYNEAAPASGITPRFIVADMLDSTSLVTTGTGVVAERLFYDPFGKRIDVDGVPVASASTTQHGYTDHWHDDELGLINMRGRVYDPKIRRFLTPDPIVSNPFLGEAYNRYSYVLNDPVNYIDPSGFQEASPGVGGIPAPPDAHTYGPCPVGGCGWQRRDGGGRAMLSRSDSQGWQGFGCPQSAGGWASGPCPPGQVLAGCGGASETPNEFLLFEFHPEYGDMFPYQMYGSVWPRTLGEAVENLGKDVQNIGALVGNTLGRMGKTMDVAVEAAVDALGGSPGDARTVSHFLAVPRGMVGLVTAGTKVAATRPLLSERLSYVYIQRATRTGEFTKWGATSVGLLRYSALARRFLGVEVVAMGSRRDMWALEYELTTRFPGILNLEKSHAGRFAAVPFPVTLQAHEILVRTGFISP